MLSTPLRCLYSYDELCFQQARCTHISSISTLVPIDKSYQASESRAHYYRLIPSITLPLIAKVNILLVRQILKVGVVVHFRILGRIDSIPPFVLPDAITPVNP